MKACPKLRPHRALFYVSCLTGATYRLRGLTFVRLDEEHTGFMSG